MIDIWCIYTCILQISILGVVATRTSKHFGKLCQGTILCKMPSPPAAVPVETQWAWPQLVFSFTHGVFSPLESTVFSVYRTLLISLCPIPAVCCWYGEVTKSFTHTELFGSRVGTRGDNSKRNDRDALIQRAYYHTCQLWPWPWQF